MATPRNQAAKDYPLATAAMLLLLATSGCAAFRATPRSTPQETGDTPTESQPEQQQSTPRTVNRVELPPGPDDLLAEVQRHLQIDDFGTAAAICRQITIDYPGSRQAAQALFQLAALHWNPTSPTYDPKAAMRTLARVTREHPESPWAPAARAILAMARDKAGLESALATLQAQLDELKALDLEPQG